MRLVLLFNSAYFSEPDPLHKLKSEYIWVKLLKKIVKNMKSDIEHMYKIKHS